MKNGEYEPYIFFQTTRKDLDPLWEEYIQQPGLLHVKLM